MVHKPKNGITLQIAIAAGLSVIIIFLLIIVGVDTKNIAEKMTEMRTEINAQTKQSREITRLKGEAAIAEDKQKVLEAVFPKKDELFSFSNKITEIGTEKSVGTNFSFGSESSSQIGYNLIAQGGYTNIIEFINALGSDIPFMNISSFDLVLGGGGYSVNLSGNVFFNGEEG